MRLLLPLLLFFFALCGQSPADYAKFYKLCKKVVQDEAAFQEFRRDPLTLLFMDTVTYAQGQLFREVIVKEYPHLLTYLPLFRLSETVGNPIVHSFETLGCFCPSTLQHIKVAGDLQREFGDIRRWHIVEIGGGYGGLCKILWDLGGFASYTLIAPGPFLDIAKKFLELQGVRNVTFLDYDALIVSGSLPRFDLVVSTHLTSTRIEQEHYVQKVFVSASHGYVSWTTEGTYPLKEVLNQLRGFGKSCALQPERPITTPTCKRILW